MATPLSYRTWMHPAPHAVAFLVHGLGANSSWWEEFAQFLIKKEITSYAIDLRSYTSFREFYAAMYELRAIIKKDNPGRKVFAVGESMGALVILSMALKDGAVFDGIACISPAFHSKAPLKLPDYLDIFLPLLYNRKKQYHLPVTSDMCTRDPVYLKIIEATYDKDVLSTSQVLFDIFVIQQSMKASRLRFGIPVIFLVAGADKLVDPASTRRVFDRIIAGDKAMIGYPEMYHSLSIDVGREKVFHDIFDWISRRI